MKIVYCPVNGWDCPCWNKNGTCQLGMDAIKECDDFTTFWDKGDEFWEEDESPPEVEPDFWIASTEEIEPAPADETWGWDE